LAESETRQQHEERDAHQEQVRRDEFAMLGHQARLAAHTIHPNRWRQKPPVQALPPSLPWKETNK
jgi:hypothetical protein